MSYDKDVENKIKTSIRVQSDIFVAQTYIAVTGIIVPSLLLGLSTALFAVGVATQALPKTLVQQEVALKKIQCERIGIPLAREILKEKLLKKNSAQGDESLKKNYENLKTLLSEIRIFEDTDFLKKSNPELAKNAKRKFLLEAQKSSALKTYKKSLVEKIRSSPQEARKFLFSKKEDTLVRELSENCAPEPADNLEGELISEHADDFQNNASVTRFFLQAHDGKRYLLNLSRQDTFLESGMRLKLKKAWKIDNDILVDDYSITREVGNPPVFGPKRVIGFIVKSQDQGFPTPSVTREKAAENIFSTVNDFFQRNSYQQTRIVGDRRDPGTVLDVFPEKDAYEIDIPYRCSKDDSKSCNPQIPNSCGGKGECLVECSDIKEIADQVVALSDPVVRFEDRTRAVIFLPKELSCGFEGIAGGYREFESPDTGGKFLFAPVLISKPFRESTTAHELGHTFGLHHATFRNCQGNMNISLEDCPIVEEYGNRYDVMGFGNLWHMNAPNKAALSWFQEDDGTNTQHAFKTVTESGTYYLAPLESQEYGVKALRVPHDRFYGGGERDAWPYLYIEYRKPIDLDAGLQNYYKDSTDIFQGALLQSGSQLSLWTALFDAYPPGNYLLSSLPYGQSYRDANTGTKITIGTPEDSGLLPVTVDAGRTDVEKPKNLELKELPQTNPCTVEYEAKAFDESGISKIEFYMNNSLSHYTLFDPPVVKDTAPYVISVDLSRYASGKIWFRAYDKASSQGGVLGDNFSDSIQMDISSGEACDVEPPKFTVLYPEPGKAAKSPAQFKIKFEDKSALQYVSVNIEERNNTRLSPIIKLGTQFFLQDLQYVSEYIFQSRPIELEDGKYTISVAAMDLYSNNLASSVVMIVSRACQDGKDNDGDGRIDYKPDGTGDPGCSSIDDYDEEFACDNNYDDDSDGYADMSDLGCESLEDQSEKSILLACDDGIDNDRDGFVDYYLGISKLNDGDKDCIDSSYTTEKPAFTFDWTKEFEEDITFTPFRDDLEEDGKEEIIVIAKDTLYVFQETDESSYGPKILWQYKFPANIAERPVAGDIDGDGKKEIVVPVKTRSLSFMGQTFVLKQDSKNSSFGTVLFSADTDYVHFFGISFLDFNGDGKQDILNGQLNNLRVIFYNESLPDKREYLDIPISVSILYAPAVGDFNKDGREDIAIADERGRVIIYSYDPTVQSHSRILWQYNLDGKVNSRPYIADMNGDGRLDVVASIEMGILPEDNLLKKYGVYIIEEDSATPGRGKKLWSYSALDISKHDLIFGILDINNDQQLEVISSNYPQAGWYVPFVGIFSQQSPESNDGKMVWSTEIYSQGQRGFVAADTDNNSLQEIFINNGGLFVSWFELRSGVALAGKLTEFFNIIKIYPNNIKYLSLFSGYECNKMQMLIASSRNLMSFTNILPEPKATWPMIGFDSRNTNWFRPCSQEAVKQTAFIRGDSNGDGELKITDPIFILDYLFLGGVKEIPCMDSADVNDDGVVTISDAIYLLDYLFTGTEPPPKAPFGSCSSDPTPDNLGCSAFRACAGG